VGRQRINANGFLTPYDLFERKTQYPNPFSNHKCIITPILFRKLLTLFAPILLHHSRLLRSSSSLPMLFLPMLSTDYLSFPAPGELGPPSPPFFFPIKLFIHFSYLYIGITSIEARGDYKSGEPPPRGDRLFKLVFLHFSL
jgi:hypothetical protein